MRVVIFCRRILRFHQGLTQSKDKTRQLSDHTEKNQHKMAGATKKLLISLDFDYTVIDENSDTRMIALCPGGEAPKQIKDLYDGSCWTDYMAAVFKFLHQNNVAKEDILRALDKIKLTTGFSELIRELPHDRVEFIIVSDANSVFISHIMEGYDLAKYISFVYTNPAWFDSRGELHIKPYHLQDWCEYSCANLCKGFVIDEYIARRGAEGVEFPFVAHVGDGQFDFCPALKMRKEDGLYPREGFHLDKFLERWQNDSIEIKPEVVKWVTGFDLLDIFKAKVIKHLGS